VVAREIESILKTMPEVESHTVTLGYSFLSQVSTTYNAYFSVNLKPWSERTDPSEQYDAILNSVNRKLEQLPEARSLAFSPPPIPGDRNGRRRHVYA